MKNTIAAREQRWQSLPLYGRWYNESQFLHSAEHVVGHVGLANLAEGEGFWFGASFGGDRCGVQKCLYWATVGYKAIGGEESRARV